MIERWNATVKPQDYVYHLGDLTLLRGSNAAQKLSFVRGLNGHKRLILGNHDHFDVKEYRDAGFEKVFGLHRPQRDIILSHIPLHEGSLSGVRLNIHGHIHRHNSPPGPYRNACVEKWNYTPVAWEVICA